MMKIFKDRISAGKILAERLKNTTADLVLGIPRGGVVIAAEVAKALKLPLDIVVVRKIGDPMQEELALGAVDSDGEAVLDESLIHQFAIKKAWKEVKRREDEYRQDKDPINVDGKTVILVDDGIATGATTLSAIKYLQRHGAKKIILAIPVASPDVVEKLNREVDEVIALHTPEYFQAVGQFYQNFLPVSDEEVIQFLKHG